MRTNQLKKLSVLTVLNQILVLLLFPLNTENLQSTYTEEIARYISLGANVTILLTVIFSVIFFRTIKAIRHQFNASMRPLLTVTVINLLLLCFPIISAGLTFSLIGLGSMALMGNVLGGILVSGYGLLLVLVFFVLKFRLIFLILKSK